MSVFHIAHVFAVIAAVTFSGSSRASADDPYPARYERMISPNSEYILFEHSNLGKWADSYSGVSYGWGPGKNHRVVDLEVDVFDVTPTTAKGGVGNQALSVLAVPNEGPLAVENWLMAYGHNAYDMKQILDPSFSFLKGGNTPPMRPIDLELYYRKSPFTGKWEATYAFVAVENTGLQYAKWIRVGPKPINVLIDELQNGAYGAYRAYDVEFAVDGDGHVMGVALMTHDEDSGAGHYPWAVKWFDPMELDTLRADGWQLIDMEMNPGLFPQTLVSDDLVIPDPNSPWPEYFGVFVFADLAPPVISDEPTKAVVAHPLTPAQMDNFGWFKPGKARMVDIEFAGFVVQPDNGEDDGPFTQALGVSETVAYATALLHPTDSE